MVLAGDIGGTKSLFALIRSQEDKPIVLWEGRYASGDFPSFDALIDKLKGDLKEDRQDLQQLSHAALAVAGPVQNNHCLTTNLPWSIDARQLAAAFQIEQAYLLNDVEATALCIAQFDSQQLTPLTPWTKREKQKAIAIIAPGTGLGEAALFWDGSRYRAQASEGGHKDFSACSAQEFALRQFACERFPDHVSTERVLGGNGLTLIYDFLQLGGRTQSEHVEKTRAMQGDTNAVISHLAITKQDQQCEETLTLYSQILAGECANLALQYMSLGGVVLAGGIPPKILPALLAPPFIERYLAKGRYKGLLEKTPVFVCTEERAALFGAAVFASA